MMGGNEGLKGKVALVSGATSGIGAATALALADAGASVALCGRDARRGEAMQQKLQAIDARCLLLLGDVTESSFCAHAVSAVVEKFGRIDILANIAGTIRRGDATQTSDEDWRANMATNVDGTFFLSRAAVAAMRQGAGGSIINLASTVGLVGAPGLAAYCASKGAVVNLTRAMALDHAAEGIRINAVCPGAVDTPLLVSEHHVTGLSPEEVHAMNTSSIPQGRIPDPEEVAAVILFLASEASSHVTGAIIPVDGGYTAG